MIDPVLGDTTTGTTREPDTGDKTPRTERQDRPTVTERNTPTSTDLRVGPDLSAEGTRLSTSVRGEEVPGGHGSLPSLPEPRCVVCPHSPPG